MTVGRTMLAVLIVIAMFVAGGATVYFVRPTASPIVPAADKAAAEVPGPKVNTKTEDTNADGKADHTVVTNESGELLRVEDDRNGDGVVDRIERYSPPDRLDRIDLDENFNRKFEEYDTTNGHGQVVMSYFDADWDSLPESWAQRGENGRIVAMWSDQNEDNAPETYRSFDQLGYLQQVAEDKDGNGLFERQMYFIHSWSESQPESIDHDDNRDGNFERREIFAKDGWVQMIQLDTNLDGMKDLHRVLNRQGEVIREGLDRDLDGRFEEWRYRVGNSVFVAHDDDLDEEVDRWDPPGPPPGWCAARCSVRSTP